MSELEVWLLSKKLSRNKNKEKKNDHTEWLVGWGGVVWFGLFCSSVYRYSCVIIFSHLCLQVVWVFSRPLSNDFPKNSGLNIIQNWKICSDFKAREGSLSRLIRR